MNFHFKNFLLIFLFFLGLYGLTCRGSIDTDDAFHQLRLAENFLFKGKFLVPYTDASFVSPLYVQNLFVPIGQAALMLPLYLLDKIFAVSFLNSIFGALLCALFYILCTSFFNHKNSLLLTLGLGLSTLLWPYSKSSYNAIEEAFFVFLAFFLGARYLKKPSLWALLFMLLSILGAFFIRMSGVIPLFIFFIFALLVASKRHRIILLALTTLTLSILIFWNLTFYDHILGIFKHISHDLFTLSFWQHAFSTPFFKGFLGLLFSPGKGFFIYTPLALLGVWGFYFFAQHNRPLFYLSLALLGSYILFYSKLRFWAGDWAWGPRYLVVLIPYFIWPIGYLLEQVKKVWIKPLFLSLCVLGILIQLPFLLTSISSLYYTYTVKEKIHPDFHLTPLVSEIYSKPRLSPIFLSWKTVFTLSSRIKTYQYEPLPSDFFEKLAKVMRESSDPQDYKPFVKQAPVYNLFDVWWLYEWYTLKLSHPRSLTLRLFLFFIGLLFISSCGLLLSFKFDKRY